MRHHRVLVLIILGVLLLVGLFIIFQLFVSKNTSSEAPVEPTKYVKKGDVNLTGYDNQSGFSFSYPENLTYEDTTDDETEYASMKFDSDNVKGILTVTVVDTEVASVTEWLDDNGIGADEEVETYPFADIEATMVETKNSVLGVALDEGAIFVFEAKPEGNAPYWKDVIATMFTTFEFVDPEGDVVPEVPAQGGTDNADIIFEGEEIIQ